MQRIANPSSPVRLWIAPPKSSFGIKKVAPSGANFVCGWYLVAATLSWTEIGQFRIPVPPHQSSRLCSVQAALYTHTSWEGYPLQNPALPTPPHPHPHSLKWVPPEHLYCVPLKRFKIRGSLSKVRHLGSVRMVRVIVGLGGLSRGGRFWLRVLF